MWAQIQVDPGVDNARVIFILESIRTPVSS
jgi:hypothetical protein